MLLLVGGIGLCISIYKQPDVPFPHVCDEIFIVNLIVFGVVVQLDPGEVKFFALLGLMVSQHVDYIL